MRRASVQTGRTSPCGFSLRRLAACIMNADREKTTDDDVILPAAWLMTSGEQRQLSRSSYPASDVTRIFKMACAALMWSNTRSARHSPGCGA